MQVQAGEQSTGKQWLIPTGAEHIVKSIAAEHILHELLNHFGDASQIDWDTVGNVVSQFPDTCHKVYEFAWYQNQTRVLSPLAVLCCLSPPLNLVKLVYDHNPGAICLAEPTTTAIPLDYACSYEAPLEVVKFLVGRYPAAAETPRHESLLPLHLACHFQANPDVVSYLLSACPSAAQNCESEGWYPLHAAAAGRASLQVCQEVFHANPTSATSQDSANSTPLHIACSNRADPSIVEFLMKAAPQALFMEDADTLTPLFRAVRNSTVEVVKLMLDENDDLVTVDHLGGTLLHHSSGHGSAEVVDLVAKRFPDMLAMHTGDHDRFIPLHVACLFGSSLDVVKTLVKHKPESIHAIDTHGRKPIQLASDTTLYRYLKEYQQQQGRPSSIARSTGRT
mmetsp:Transcript_437/g.1210  ORF Transcript_437/g.1210 Transcript_437/m.1210 type:complete len:394 (+) Transcript_437:150-1331(+)